MQCKVIMGVDPSSTTGCVIKDVGTGSVLFKEHIKDNSVCFVKRGDNIGSRIRSLCEEYKVDIICIEDYAMNAKFRLVDMVKLGTALRLQVAKYTNIPMYNLPPKKLKLWATKKGNASKTEMKAHCLRRFGFTGNNDMVDAYLLATYMEYALNNLVQLDFNFWGITFATYDKQERLIPEVFKHGDYGYTKFLQSIAQNP